MKKIGIITFHRAYNYGAMLQAYALERKLNELEKNKANIIDYYNNTIYDRYKPIRPIHDTKSIKTILRRIKDIMQYRKNNSRKQSFEKFIKEEYELSDRCDENNIANIIKDYDIVITGSDQVWNKDIVGELSDIYSLSFINDSNIKKISYAASIGNSKMIAENKSEYKEKLSGIDYISVREDDARVELEKIINKNIETVLDPTLLLTKKEWESIIRNQQSHNEKYIIAYVIAPDEEYVKIVNDLSKKTGLKVVHFGRKNPGYKDVLKSAYTEGTLNFVNLIKNAEYVVATSFHATVFSIIFNKKFFVVPHKKTGVRVTNLLNKLEIANRSFNTYDEFKDIDYNFETDWNKVESNLEKEREKSLNWLKNAIEDKNRSNYEQK